MMFTLFGFSVSRSDKIFGVEFCVIDTTSGGSGGLFQLWITDGWVTWDFLFLHSLYQFVKAHEHD